jgi:hypothetical protein
MTPSRALRPLLAVVLAAIAIAGWTCLLAPTAWFVSPITQTIEPAGITPNAGRSYVAPVPLKPDYGTFLQVESDHIFGPRTSNLKMHEDGKLLGPLHSYHSDIWEKGGGRYSHWGNAAGSAVIFSASDNSDPRVNGRRYEFVVQPAYSALLVGVLLVAALTSSVLLAWTVQLPWKAATFVLAAAALLSWGALYFGHVSVSEDTSNYTDWLPTVPLGYPLFLSAIKLVTGSLRWTGAVQAALLTSACVLVALQVIRLSGRAAAGLAALAALLVYTPMFEMVHGILSEGLFLPLILVNIGAAFCLIHRPHIGYAILLAFSASWIMFVRPAGYFAIAGVLFLIVACNARLWLVRWALIPTIAFIACTAITNVAVRGSGTPSQVGRVLFPHVAFLFQPQYATPENREYGQVAFDAIANNRDGYMRLTDRTDRFNYILNDYNRRLLASDVAIYRKFVDKDRGRPAGEDDHSYRFRRMNEIYLSLFLSTISHEPLRYLRLIAEQLLGAWQYSIFYDYGRFRDSYLLDAGNGYEIRAKYVRERKLPLSEADVRYDTGLMNQLPGDFAERLDTVYRNIRTQRWLIYLIGAVTLVAIPLGGLVFRNSWHWVALGHCGVMIHGSMLLTAAATVFIPRYAIPVDPVIMLAGVIAMDGILTWAASIDRRAPTTASGYQCVLQA